MPFAITPFTVTVALVMGSLSAFLANKRGYNPYTWFTLGFFFGLIGMMAIFFLAPKKPTRSAPRAAVKPQLKGPMDKLWYYLDPSHAQQGPMSFDALSRAFCQGKISPSTYVWHDELSDWKLLKEFVVSTKKP